MEGARRTPAALRHVPNSLSGARFVCAIVFPFAPEDVRLPLVLLAAASDWLDGWIARRIGATSWFGGLLDGLSDKAFVVTALVTLTLAGELTPWQVPFLLLRDASVASGVLVSALRRDREAFHNMDSRTYGKLTTVVIFGLLVVLLAWPDARLAHGVLYTGGAVLSAMAGIDYFFARQARILGRQRS